MATKMVLLDNSYTDFKKVKRVALPFGSAGEELVFAQGDQIVLGDLVAGTRDTYQGALVTDIATEIPSIIYNQNTYADEDGNRTGYVANVGRITYKSGDVVSVLAPSEDVKFIITQDAVNGTIAVGKYLVPELGATDTRLAIADDLTGVKVGYKVEALENVPVGKNFVSSAIVNTVLA